MPTRTAASAASNCSGAGAAARRADAGGDRIFVAPAAAGGFAAVPLTISPQQMARDRAFVQRAFAARGAGRQMINQRRNLRARKAATTARTATATQSAKATGRAAARARCRRVNARPRFGNRTNRDSSGPPHAARPAIASGRARQPRPARAVALRTCNEIRPCDGRRRHPRRVSPRAANGPAIYRRHADRRQRWQALQQKAIIERSNSSAETQGATFLLRIVMAYGFLNQQERQMSIFRNDHIRHLRPCQRSSARSSARIQRRRSDAARQRPDVERQRRGGAHQARLLRTRKRSTGASRSSI